MPTSQVDIAIDYGAGAQVNVSPSSVSFTTGNYNVPQTITVTAIDDPVAEGAHDQAISFTLTSGDTDYNGLSVTDVTANITDNDTAGILVSPNSNLVTTESGGVDSFNVVLETRPTNDVTIPVSSGDITEGTVSVSSLTFNSGNWDTPQTVIVTGIDDAIDDGPVAYTVTLGLPTTSDVLYGAIDPSDVTLTNSDDDGVDVIFTQSSGSTDVSEDGIIDSYSVVLNTQPLDDVVVTAVPGSGLNVTPSTLTFTTANWNSAQSFAVSAIDDDVAEGDHSGSITHTASSTGDVDYDGLAISNISVDITDNDSASIVVTPQSGLIVSENGNTDSFTIVLGSQPTGNVTIPISSTVLADATVSPASVIFTDANWNVPQAVTVTGVDDGAVNDGDIAFTIVTDSASSTDSSYNAVNPSDVTGVNQDNDQAAVLITVNDNLLDESNAGNTASYDVVLSVDPTDTVTVTISPDADSSYAGASLIFNSGNYSTPQTVTINVVDDQIAEGTHQSTITHGVSAASGPYNGISATDVVIGVADDDTVGVQITPTTGIETDEINSSPDSFDVMLLSQPLSDVTIALASSDTDQANVSTNLLTFTAANWNTPQTVTVTGADGNSTDDGDIVFTIVTGDTICADSNYNGVIVADISGTNRSVNNEPTLAAIANQNATEDDPPQVVVLTGISDGQTGESQTLTITATSSNPTVIPDPVVVDNNDGTAQLTYTPASNQFDPAVTITVTVVDSGSNTAPSDNTISRSFNVNVASENDLPDINVASIVYNSENVALVASTGATNAINNTALNSTDVEDVDSSLTYTLVLKPGQGNVRNTNTASNISPGGTWTQDDIDQGYIVYVHDGLPGGVTDGFAFTVTDSEGGESAEVFQIYVDREAPSITLDASDLIYNENDGALAIDSGAVVTAGDIEPFNNGYLLVEWAAGSTANDNIVMSGSATVDGSGNVSLPGPGIIGTIDSIQNGVGGNDLLINFVTGTPTAANVLTLARSIAYQNDNDDPSTTIRTVQMTLNDGFLNSGTIPRNISMQAINDDPLIGSANFGTILNVNLTANLPVSDVDGTIQTIVVTAAPSLGAVTITDAATGAFLYQPTPNLSGSDTFDILVTDDLGATTAGTINVHITDVNSVHPRVTSDPPMFALDGDLLVYTPVVDPTTYTGNLTFQLIDKPAGFTDPHVFGTISWDLTGHGGEVLRFSYLILDDGNNEVGFQPILIHVLPAPGGGS